MQQEPLTITVSLASHVLSLSTRASYGHLVSPSGAFFGEGRFSRRILLLVLLSFVCLASSSQSLNRYAIFPNNYVRLASICRPHSLASVALTTFRSIPGQSFAFVSIAGVEPTFDLLEGDCITIMQYCEPTSMCCPSCSISCQIQNTTHRLPFVLRTTQRLFKYPGPNPSTLKMLPCLCLRAQTLQLPVNFQHSLAWLKTVWAPTLLPLTDWLCGYPFGQSS